MEPLTIETLNPDMIKAANSEQKRAGDINYTSVSSNTGKVRFLLLGLTGNSDYLDSRIPREIFTHYP